MNTWGRICPLFLQKNTEKRLEKSELEKNPASLAQELELHRRAAGRWRRAVPGGPKRERPRGEKRGRLRRGARVSPERRKPEAQASAWFMPTVSSRHKEQMKMDEQRVPFAY